MAGPARPAPERGYAASCPACGGPGNRLRIELRPRMRRHDDSAIAGAGNRRPDYRLAEVRVVPADGGAPVGIVHVDGDIAAALGGGEFCLSVRRGPESQAARRDCRPPAEMLLSDGAVEAADIAHVDETLGREVHGAL